MYGPFNAQSPRSILAKETNKPVKYKTKCSNATTKPDATDPRLPDCIVCSKDLSFRQQPERKAGIRYLLSSFNAISPPSVSWVGTLAFSFICFSGHRGLIKEPTVVDVIRPGTLWAAGRSWPRKATVHSTQSLAVQRKPLRW